MIDDGAEKAVHFLTEACREKDAEIERLRNVTIERCAQVAEQTPHSEWFKIAAAIRKLKDAP